MSDKTPAPAPADGANRRIEYVPLDTLQSDPKNPKSHSLEAIDASFGRFGVVDVVTVDGRTGYIISGHGRTTALRDMYSRGEEAPEGVTVTEEGKWLVPVNLGWSSRNDAEAAAALISMNRTTELGGWVDESLLALLDQISESGAGFDGVGFSATDMDDLRHLLEDVPDLDDLADEWENADVDTTESGTASVKITLLDSALIERWHALRDTTKSDDEAFAVLIDAYTASLELAPAPAPSAATTARAARADADIADELATLDLAAVPSPAATDDALDPWSSAAVIDGDDETEEE